MKRHIRPDYPTKTSLYNNIFFLSYLFQLINVAIFFSKNFFHRFFCFSAIIDKIH